MPIADLLFGIACGTTLFIVGLAVVIALQRGSAERERDVERRRAIERQRTRERRAEQQRQALQRERARLLASMDPRRALLQVLSERIRRLDGDRAVDRAAAPDEG